MSRYLHMLVDWIALAHRWILRLNDTFEYTFSDKELHFLVIGLLGLLMLLAVYPVFKLLSRKNRVLAIAWIYVFTVELVITFAIEIGQRATGTGSMDFEDVLAGLAGFFFITAIILLLRFLWWIISLMLGIGRHGKKKKRRS